MNKIDEIALRIWYANNTCMPADGMNKLKEFAHALLAELSKDVEPSLYRWKTGHNFEYQFSEQRENAPEYATKYFTHPAPVIASEQKPNDYVQQVADHCDRIVWRNKYFHLPPPNTADIEQRTAEAIAHWIRCGDHHGVITSDDVLAGKWREYL